MANKNNEVEVSILPNCDFCGKPASYDAATNMGPWANMCYQHYMIYRMHSKLGTGLGQKLILAKKLSEKT